MQRNLLGYLNTYGKFLKTIIALKRRKNWNTFNHFIFNQLFNQISYDDYVWGLLGLERFNIEVEN